MQFNHHISIECIYFTFYMYCGNECVLCCFVFQCYDMRFPEMSVALRNLGAEILTFPSAFTVPTGMAHWHVSMLDSKLSLICHSVLWSASL